MAIYQVEVVPSAGPDAGEALVAVLLGIGYNPTSNKFQLLFSATGDGQGAVRMVAHDQIARLTVKGLIGD